MAHHGAHRRTIPSHRLLASPRPGRVLSGDGESGDVAQQLQRIDGIDGAVAVHVALERVQICPSPLQLKRLVEDADRLEDLPFVNEAGDTDLARRNELEST